jgi:hypothetical protein
LLGSDINTRITDIHANPFISVALFTYYNVLRRILHLLIRVQCLSQIHYIKMSVHIIHWRLQHKMNNCVTKLPLYHARQNRYSLCNKRLFNIFDRKSIKNLWYWLIVLGRKIFWLWMNILHVLSIYFTKQISFFGHINFQICNKSGSNIWYFADCDMSSVKLLH